MRETAGTAAALATRCRNRRRGSFTGVPSLNHVAGGNLPGERTGDMRMPRQPQARCRMSEFWPADGNSAAITCIRQDFGTSRRQLADSCPVLAAYNIGQAIGRAASAARSGWPVSEMRKRPAGGSSPAANASAKARAHLRSCFKRRPSILFRQRRLSMLRGGEIVELVFAYPLVKRCFIGKPVQQTGQPPGQALRAPYAA
jgi:hypothetical protein